MRVERWKRKKRKMERRGKGRGKEKYVTTIKVFNKDTDDDVFHGRLLKAIESLHYIHQSPTTPLPSTLPS